MNNYNSDFKKVSIPAETIKQHYQRCKDAILSYCKETNGAFRSLIGDHKIWWKTDKGKGTAKLFYPEEENYDYLTSKCRTLYWTAQLFTPETANVEKPYDFEKPGIREQIGGREDTVYHSFFLDLDKAKDRGIHEPKVIEWLEKAAKFFADKLIEQGVESFRLAFSGGGIYCVLHPRLGMMSEGERDYAYKVALIQRAFDLFIGDTAAAFFEKNSEAIEYVKFDKLNYDAKRQVKTILSIHKKYPYAVIPLDNYNPKIDLDEATLPISDEVIEGAKNWLAYHNDIEKFGNFLKPYIDRAKELTQKTHRESTATIEREEITEENWAPCMRNLLTKKELKAGYGATRALAVLASYMRFLGVTEDKAYEIFQRKAEEWNAETSNIFESWYGCEHLDIPTCFVPSCEKLRTKGSGYPHPELGELNICTPDERCKETYSPIQYHKVTEKNAEVEDKSNFFYKKNAKPKLDVGKLLEDILAQYIFKTTNDMKTVYVYDGGIYSPGEIVIERAVEKRIGDVATRFVVNEIIGHIQRRSYTSRSLFNTAKDLLPLKNGLLDLKTFELKKFDPEIIFTYKLPVKYDPTAECPNIKKFLKEVLNEDDVPIMQETCGYCLYQKYPAHKSFWWFGTGRNGKTTVANLLITLLGKENVANVPLNALDGNHQFAIARLFGKLVNIIAEPSANKAFATEIFKSLTGGDLIDAELKNVQWPMQFVNFAKFIIYANRVPRINDETQAFWERVIAIDFPNTFIGPDAIKDYDKELVKLDGLSGFLNWTLEGLKRLQKNNWEFTNSKAMMETKILMERHSQPVLAFVKEWCEMDMVNIIPKDEVYAAYCFYCETHQMFIYKKETFSKELQVAARVRETRVGKKGSRVQCWQGLKFRESINVLVRLDNGKNPELPLIDYVSGQSSQSSQGYNNKVITDYIKAGNKRGDHLDTSDQKEKKESEEKESDKQEGKKKGKKPKSPIKIRENICEEKGECEICHYGDKREVNLPYVVHYSNGDFKTVCTRCGDQVMQDYNLKISKDNLDTPNRDSESEEDVSEDCIADGCELQFRPSLNFDEDTCSQCLEMKAPAIDDTSLENYVLSVVSSITAQDERGAMIAVVVNRIARDRCYEKDVVKAEIERMLRKNQLFISTRDVHGDYTMRTINGNEVRSLK